MDPSDAHHPPSALPPGTRLAEFELRKVLGLGGFGIVYLAFDHALEREVAIKEYMPSSLVGRTGPLQVSLLSQAHAESFALGLRSFVNEARLLARFDDPSLVKVHRYWEANGTAYMAMPYFTGTNLHAVRRRMGTPPGELWLRSVLMPLLGALERLHAEGIFHRDISPDNIILQPDNRPVLLDFGAARRVLADKSVALTAILKPAYAPIEQYGEAGAVKQGPWTDLYALGATLHFLLLGRAPPPATARAVEDAMVPLDSLPELRACCSVGFLKAVDWMLRPRPGDRPQSVAALREALARPVQPAPGPALTDWDPTQHTDPVADDDGPTMIDLSQLQPPPLAPPPPADMRRTVLEPRQPDRPAPTPDGRTMRLPRPGDDDTPTLRVPRPGGDDAPTMRVPRPGDGPAPTMRLPRPGDDDAPTMRVPRPGDDDAPTLRMPRPALDDAPTIRVPRPDGADTPTQRLPPRPPPDDPTVRIARPAERPAASPPATPAAAGQGFSAQRDDRPAPPPAARGKQTSLLWPAVAVVAVAGGLGAWLLLKPAAPADRSAAPAAASAPAAEPAASAVGTTPATPTSAAPAADGTTAPTTPQPAAPAAPPPAPPAVATGGRPTPPEAARTQADRQAATPAARASAARPPTRQAAAPAPLPAPEPMVAPVPEPEPPRGGPPTLATSITRLPPADAAASAARPAAAADLPRPAPTPAAVAPALAASSAAQAMPLPAPVTPARGGDTPVPRPAREAPEPVQMQSRSLSPAERCDGRVLMALWACVDRICRAEPGLRDHPDCVKNRRDAQLTR